MNGASRPVAMASSYTDRVGYRVERRAPRCEAMAVTGSFASRWRRAMASLSPSTAAVRAVRRGGVQSDEGPFVGDLPFGLGLGGEHDEEDLARADTHGTALRFPCPEEIAKLG
ncbi:hypothetical protein [Streptomyces niveus]